MIIDCLIIELKLIGLFKILPQCTASLAVLADFRVDQSTSTWVISCNNVKRSHYHEWRRGRGVRSVRGPARRGSAVLWDTPNILEEPASQNHQRGLASANYPANCPTVWERLCVINCNAYISVNEAQPWNNPVQQRRTFVIRFSRQCFLLRRRDRTENNGTLN